MKFEFLSFHAQYFEKTKEIFLSLKKWYFMEWNIYKRYCSKYLFEGKSAFLLHFILLILSNSVLLWLGSKQPVTKGDPLYEANENTLSCEYLDEISFFIIIVSFFEMFIERHS